MRGPDARPPERVLSHAQARWFYDSLGSWLDSQRFYENPAVFALLSGGRFRTARSVFEFGCGTGRLAVRLLSAELPATARYTGVDISPTMVALTRRRLQRWADRVDVRATDGAPGLQDADRSHDRFVSTYVLDLLPTREIQRLLEEAHRILAADGVLCLVTLTAGSGGLARAVTHSWTALHSIHPLLVGGCRPLHASDHLSTSEWRIDRQETIVAFGVPSEVTIATRRGN